MDPVAHHQQLGYPPCVIVMQRLAVDRLIEQQAGNKLRDAEDEKQQRYVDHETWSVWTGH